MKKLTLLMALAIAGALSAQVASEANSGYKTEQQRKQMAATLANPERDSTQKPAQLIRDMEIKEGTTVADVGTGVGYMLPFLSRAVGPQGKVIAEGTPEEVASDKHVIDAYLGTRHARAGGET